MEMEIEHVALNVPDPAAMARWYVEQLGMRVVVGNDSPPYAHFLADSAGHVMLEIYLNPPDDVPDYGARHQLQFHIAFVSSDPPADRRRLEAAGATFVEDIHLPDGGYLVTMRDPWGVPLQFVRRGRALGQPLARPSAAAR